MPAGPGAGPQRATKAVTGLGHAHTQFSLERSHGQGHLPHRWPVRGPVPAQTGDASVRRRESEDAAARELAGRTGSPCASRWPSASPARATACVGGADVDISLAGRQLTGRIAALLARSGPWSLPRIRRYLGWPQVSPRTLYRRVRLMAIWRRPKLTARGDPDHDHVVAGIGRAPTGDPIVVSVVQVKALSNSRARSPSSSAITRNLAAASDTLPRKRIVNDFTSRFRGDAHRAAYGTRASCHVTM